jgi:hypothetical protein
VSLQGAAWTRHGQPLTIKMRGTVEPFFKEETA